MLNLSTLCRLCCSEVTFGVDIFLVNNDHISLAILINKYLPIKVMEDDLFPRKICEACHMSCASSIDFIDRLVKGQLKLQDCLNKLKSRPKEQSGLQHNISEVQNIVDKYLPNLELEDQISNGLEDMCKTNVLLNIQGDLPNIVMNDLSKGSSVENIYKEHEISNSIKKIQAKKGRPKKIKSEISYSDINPDRPKRRVCPPSRYKDSIAGRDFEDLLSEKDDYMTLERLQDGSAQLNTLFDGSTVIVTPNCEKNHSKLPEEVNIELDFKLNNTSNIGSSVGCMETMSSETPTASVSGVQIVVPSKISRSHAIERYGRRNHYRKWFCDICNKRFKYKGRYLIHLSTHKNFTFQCTQCKEQFAFKHQLKNHQDDLAHQGVGIIDDNKDVKCNLCPDLTFQTNEAVMKHRSDIHNIRKQRLPRAPSKKISDSSNTYGCKICRKMFQRKGSLLLHQDRVHSDNPAFVCSICNKSFAHRQLLQKHRADVHSEERPYSCEVCSFKFKTKVSLVSHKATHSSVKRYTCEICGKVFNHLTSLTHHLQSHQGEKPHKCTYCDKSFTQKGNLLEHMRIHTGEKPFTCVVCSKTFKTSSQVSYHTKRHFRVTYKCDICEKIFIKEEALTKHIATHCHPKEQDPNIVPAATIDDCLSNVQLPMVGNLLIPDVIPDQSTTFSMPEGLSFESNPQDSSVIYIISKKDYQQLNFNNIEEEVFVENQMDNADDSFNLY